MNNRNDLSGYFNAIIQYIKQRTTIEALEQFFEQWHDLKRPAAMRSLMLYYKIMNQVFEDSERLVELHAVMATDASKAIRNDFLEIAYLWSEVRTKEEYIDWRLVLGDELKEWLEYPISPVLNRLLNSYENLNQLLTCRESNSLSRDDQRRLKQYTVLLERCEFVVVMNYLSGRLQGNIIEIDPAIPEFNKKFIHYFNRATEENKIKFIVNLRNYFLGNSKKTLKRVDQTILFDKLEELQFDRFRMFTANEGSDFNDLREQESQRMRVLEKAQAATQKRLLLANKGV